MSANSSPCACRVKNVKQKAHSTHLQNIDTDWILAVMPRAKAVALVIEVNVIAGSDSDTVILRRSSMLAVPNDLRHAASITNISSTPTAGNR